MATDITIPQLGESLTEAVIASWLKGDGEYVERDEEIVELETDKVTMPLPSPAAGVIHHGAGEGDTVAIGAVIGSIDESAKKPALSKPAQEPAKQEEAKPGVPAAAAPEPKKPAPATAAPAATATATATEERPAGASADAPRVTPLARKIADENHLDLSTITGTGPGGRIREHDVLAAVETKGNGAAPKPEAAEPTRTTPTPAASAPATATAFSRNVRRERVSQLRQRIATRLVEAQHTAAMLTTFNECDMTAVMDLRARHKEAFEKKHGVKLGFMSFFIKASCSALRAYPAVNSFLVKGDKGLEFEHHDYADIAVAVGTEKGLVVPVLRNAESLSFAGIEKGIGELAAKARDGKLTLEDMSGGTFTISNGGVYGSMMSTPILNPPQSGILGMHNIIRRPVENPDKPDSGEIQVRPMMYLALSYDHRVVDGEGAVSFLKHVKQTIESPDRLLLDL